MSTNKVKKYVVIHKCIFCNAYEISIYNNGPTHLVILDINRLKNIWHLNLIYVPDFCHAQVRDALTKHQIKTDDLVEYV